MALFSRPFLYFPGCLASSVLPGIVENYRALFEKFKIDYAMLPEETCCGAVAKNNGYQADFFAIHEKNTVSFTHRKVKFIVTNSGPCMKTFALDYGIKVQHASQILSKYVNKMPVKYEEEISIYDSPLLSIYEDPRKILEGLGFDVIELKHNKENSVLCGAEGGMIQNVPQLADKLSHSVFDLCRTKKLVVTEPLAYFHLKRNAPKNIQVLELSEVML